MLELLLENQIIETPSIEYTDYIEDANGDYLFDNTTKEWRLAEDGETGTHRAVNYLLGYIEYVEDANGEYLYDTTLKKYRLAESGETGTHTIGTIYTLFY